MKPILFALLLASAAGIFAAEPKLTAPNGFEVQRVTAAGAVRFPMFATIADDGRVFVTESSGGDLYEELQQQTRGCRISALKDEDGDGTFEKVTVFYENLVPSMGLAWKGGKLYVADPPDLITLEDTNDDGRADKRTVVLTGFGHTDNGSLHGLTFGPDGWLYMTTGQPDGYRLKRADGRILEGKSGALLRCKSDGSDVEVLCRGFENLVEMVFMPGGEMVGTDNWFYLPQDGVRDALVHLVPGGVYPLNVHAKTETNHFFTGQLLPPISVYPAVAHSGLMRYTGASFPSHHKDSLFSAQFNTRKIVRHQLTRRGMTFQSADEDFVTTHDPDFHPSDVLEDRDGSLLIVDTGSWYVHHCPTGRIRKTAAQGGIYRVRYKGPKEAKSFAIPSPVIGDAGAFVRHEFIYNLHKTAKRESLLRMLTESGAERRRAAVIVLDQAPHDALSLEPALEALKDKDAGVRAAALGAFRKHPDWMPHAVGYAKQVITRDPLEVGLLEVLISEPEIVEAVRRTIEDRQRPLETKIALLAVAATAPNKAAWQNTADTLLESKNEKLVAAALGLQAASTSALSAIAQNDSAGAGIRLEALRQLPGSSRFADERHFRFVLDCLAATNAPGTRLTAAGLLNANLSPEQREQMGRLISNDPLIAPAKQNQQEDHEKILRELEPLLPGGDENRGQQLFIGKAACTACHRVGKFGGVSGPDLTRIGMIRSGRDLIESIALPSTTFAQGYEPYRVELISGETLQGMRVRQLDESFVLRDASGADTRLRPEEIKSAERGAVSLMPEGLLSGLSGEEIRDLFAYLQSLR